MIFVYPDFYFDFSCTASRCRHSCCRGWEIDIDDDTLERYDALTGDIGDTVRRSIERTPTPHFVLTESEDCPFLQPDGLCRLILTLGEESLCDICAEHPRFYNEHPDRIEAGLGLCCEEAVRLLLERDTPLALIVETDGEVPEQTIRDDIFAILAEQGMPLSERMDRALTLVGATMPDFTLSQLAELYLGLERLDDEWTGCLERLELNAPLPQPVGMRYERLAEYFVYRHFDAERPQTISFAFLSIRLLCALEKLCPQELPELVRLYSSEIEYSDENVEKVQSVLL